MNKNTVLRALHELTDEGLLEFRRGRGITVGGTPERGAVLTLEATHSGGHGVPAERRMPDWCADL